MNRASRIPATPPSTRVLVLQVVVGMTFLLHGLDKLGDPAGAEQLFASLGIPAPDLLAPFVAVTELLLGGASPAVGIADAGRYSRDAPLDLPHRFLRRVSAVPS
jgi:uncharacterized membrane protein YphA (DoxX/SURF4 family)